MSLLSERFAEKEEQEERDYEKENAIDLYLDISGASRIDPELRKKFEDVENAVLRYNETLADFVELRRGRAESKLEAQGSDAARRAAHDALIANLNILSRSFAKRGLDNKWRDAIGYGSSSERDRTQIMKWATYIGEFLTRKEDS